MINNTDIYMYCNLYHKFRNQIEAETIACHFAEVNFKLILL